MIKLTRLNGKKFYLNCEAIKWLEATPDTLITLFQGEKVMVKESLEQVVEDTLDYQKRTRQEPPRVVRQAEDRLPEPGGGAVGGSGSLGV